MGKIKTREEFIQQVRDVHGDKYDYSKVEYVNSSTKVTITCPEHGEFEQTPTNHRRGQGCPTCGKIKERENVSKNILLRKFEGITQPEEYKLIPLTQGKVAMVDNEDFEHLSQFNWNVVEQGYAFNSKVGLMHRYIMNAPPHLEVDHKEHNRLDNRKSELRLATRPQNSANTRPRRGSSSKYTGVYWSKRAGKWVSDITKDGKKKRVGTFDTEKEAGMAYDKKALELHGEFAYLNFPELKQEYLKELNYERL